MHARRPRRSRAHLLENLPRAQGPRRSSSTTFFGGIANQPAPAHGARAQHTLRQPLRFPRGRVSGPHRIGTTPHRNAPAPHVTPLMRRQPRCARVSGARVPACATRAARAAARPQPERNQTAPAQSAGLAQPGAPQPSPTRTGDAPAPRERRRGRRSARAVQSIPPVARAPTRHAPRTVDTLAAMRTLCAAAHPPGARECPRRLSRAEVRCHTVLVTRTRARPCSCSTNSLLFFFFVRTPLDKT